MVPLFVVVLFVIENALVHWITASLDNGLDASMRQFYVRAGGPGPSRSTVFARNCAGRSRPS